MTEADKPMVTAWADFRRKFVPWNILPPDCYIAEVDGVAVAFASFALVLRAPVIYMDWLFTKPGIGFAALSAFRAMLAEVFRRHSPSYQVCRITCLDGMVGAAKRIGFVMAGSSTVEGLYRNG